MTGVSIWTPILACDLLYSVRYESHYEDARRQPLEDAYLDIAVTDSWYGHHALRLCLFDGDADAAVVIGRNQVRELHDMLDRWLRETETDCKQLEAAAPPFTDDYKQARGVVHGSEPAEKIIRRLRGGEAS